MKKYLTLGVCAASLFVNNCLGATEVKPFIGANISITAVAWTDELKETSKDIWELPTSFWGIGMNTGLRFLNDNMYNFGVTLSYDYNGDSKAKITSDAEPYLSSVRAGFSMLTAMFDNYLRVSDKDEKRLDLILGLGLSSVRERTYILPTKEAMLNGMEKIDDYDIGGAVVFKLGVGGKVNESWNWGVTGRLFVTSGNSNEGDLDSLFNLGFDVKYIF